LQKLVFKPVVHIVPSEDTLFCSTYYSVHYVASVVKTLHYLEKYKALSLGLTRVGLQIFVVRMKTHFALPKLGSELIM
jgi:hypothetical protein